MVPTVGRIPTTAKSLNGKGDVNLDSATFVAPRKYRVLALDEATVALQLERGNQVTKTSWLQPYLEELIKTCESMINKNDMEKGRIITLQYRDYWIRRSSSKSCRQDNMHLCPGEYVMTPLKGFVPMAHLCYDRLKRSITNASVS